MTNAGTYPRECEQLLLKKAALTVHRPCSHAVGDHAHLGLRNCIVQLGASWALCTESAFQVTLEVESAKSRATGAISQLPQLWPGTEVFTCCGFQCPQTWDDPPSKEDMPVLPSMPQVALAGSACLARSLVSVRMTLAPQFCASVRGITSRASPTAL